MPGGQQQTPRQRVEKQIIMDLTTVPRSIAKLEYAAIRLPLTVLDECVVARYWGEEALFRLGFEYFLGSLDGCAGWLLGDDDISARGQSLMRRTWRLATAGKPATKARAYKAQAEQDRPAGQAEARQAREQAQEKMAGKIAAAYHNQQEDRQQVRREAGAPAATEEAPAERAAGKRAAKRPGTPVRPAAKASTVDVTFTLPAEVQAKSVALCGEFNDWSADTIMLERGGDGSWRATVTLEPGRSYRYRYLLDGERWENDWHADRYVANSYGTVDSVVVVQ
jgi:hypothetical protein